MIKIINLRNSKPANPYDVYIDRRGDVGNPIFMEGEETRDLVCDQYNIRFNHMIKAKNSPFYKEIKLFLDIYEEYGKLNLFCWCAPKRCHGEKIKKWIEENYNKEK